MKMKLSVLIPRDQFMEIVNAVKGGRPRPLLAVTLEAGQGRTGFHVTDEIPENDDIDFVMPKGGVESGDGSDAITLPIPLFKRFDDTLRDVDLYIEYIRVNHPKIHKRADGQQKGCESIWQSLLKTNILVQKTKGALGI